MKGANIRNVMNRAWKRHAFRRRGESGAGGNREDTTPTLEPPRTAQIRMNDPIAFLEYFLKLDSFLSSNSNVDYYSIFKKLFKIF